MLQFQIKLSWSMMSVGVFSQDTSKYWCYQKIVKLRREANITAESIFANGPAIWGGCVTRRSIRAGSWYFSQKAVTVQGGYGALFAVMVQILLSITSVAVQVWSEPRIYPRLQIWWRALAQCRGTICLEARNLSRCRNLIVCRCAYPGATIITNLSWGQEQMQKVWQTTYP